MITIILGLIAGIKPFKNQKLYGRLLVASTATDTVLVYILLRYLI